VVVIEPDGMADDVGRKSVAGTADELVGHPATLPGSIAGNAVMRNPSIPGTEAPIAAHTVSSQELRRLAARISA
jgi:hypothetical protein